jgi:hypothetical protein
MDVVGLATVIHWKRCHFPTHGSRSCAHIHSVHAADDEPFPFLTMPSGGGPQGRATTSTRRTVATTMDHGVELAYSPSD